MAGNGEIKAHDNTYSGFVRLLKVGTAVSIFFAALVVFLIAS